MILPAARREARQQSCSQRVIGKAEHLPKGANPRFVVTNLPTHRAGARRVYETLHCARGEMENAQTHCLPGLFRMPSERFQSPA